MVYSINVRLRRIICFRRQTGVYISMQVIKWNESGFRPPLCTYRLNWARRTSWGWWDDWDDTVLQTQDAKFEPWRSEAEHATSRSRRLPTILTSTRGWGRNIFVSFKPPRPGTEPRTLAWKAAVLTTTLGPPPSMQVIQFPTNTGHSHNAVSMLASCLRPCHIKHWHAIVWMPRVCWVNIPRWWSHFNHFSARTFFIICQNLMSVDVRFWLIKTILFPANTRHWPNAGSMLAHRLRRWSNIDPALGQCLVFAGSWL